MGLSSQSTKRVNLKNRAKYIERILLSLRANFVIYFLEVKDNKNETNKQTNKKPI